MIDSQRLPELIRMTMELAEKGAALGNTPIAALLLNSDGEVVMSAYNTQRSDKDPTAHAEMNLLRSAGKKYGSIYFPGFSIIGNAEACSMCMSAGIKAQIYEYYFGAFAEPSMDPWIPAKDVASYAKNPVSVQGGILQDECAAQIARLRATQKKL